LSDEIRHEVQHDYGSKRRFLLFGVLTTIGITGITGATVDMAMFANFPLI